MRLALITIVGVFAIGGIGWRYCVGVDRVYGQPSRDLSRMMTVRNLVSDAISTGYLAHRSYPGSLGELPLQTVRWGDEGSSPADVSRWAYSSDGSSFTMSWSNALGVELFLGGVAGRVYISRDQRP